MSRGVSSVEESHPLRPEMPNNAGWATFEAKVRARRLAACLERAAGFEHSDTSEARFGKLEALITGNSKLA